MNRRNFIQAIAAALGATAISEIANTPASQEIFNPATDRVLLDLGTISPGPFAHFIPLLSAEVQNVSVRDGLATGDDVVFPALKRDLTITHARISVGFVRGIFMPNGVPAKAGPGQDLTFQWSREHGIFQIA